MPHLDAILYGGTFDPPHLGHVETVRLVRARFPGVRIVVIPAFTPAMAQGDLKRGPVASFFHRVEMCRRAFASFSGVEVSDIEAKLPSPNYTIQTLTAFGQQTPSLRLGLVMGADQFRAFPRWREPGRISSLAHLVIVPRGDDNITASDAGAILKEVGSPRTNDGDFSVTILESTPPPYASRLIREALRTGDRNALEFLPGAVGAYIEDQHLYSDEE